MSKSKTVSKRAKTSSKGEKRPYVQYSTIWKSVGGGFSNPGEARICKVGRHKVLVSRGERLDRMGNPVYTATVIDEGGDLGKSYRNTGSATLVVAEALRRSGIDTKYNNDKLRTGKLKKRKGVKK